MDRTAYETVIGFSMGNIDFQRLPTCAQNKGHSVWSQRAHPILCGHRQKMLRDHAVGRCPLPIPFLFLHFLLCGSITSSWLYQLLMVLPSSSGVFRTLSSHHPLLASFQPHPDHFSITNTAPHPQWCLSLAPGVCAGPTSPMIPMLPAYICSSCLPGL